LALQVDYNSVVLLSAFVAVSTVWSVSCLMFYSWCLSAQPFVKVGARAFLALWSARHWLCTTGLTSRKQPVTSQWA